MPSVNLLQIEHDFPELQFKEGEVFSWNPNSQTVYYEKLDSQEDLVQLLHEIAHAKLGHKNYQYDIQNNISRNIVNLAKINHPVFPV